MQFEESHRLCAIREGTCMTLFIVDFCVAPKSCEYGKLSVGKLHLPIASLLRQGFNLVPLPSVSCATSLLSKSLQTSGMLD